MMAMMLSTLLELKNRQINTVHNGPDTVRAVARAHYDAVLLVNLRSGQRSRSQSVELSIVTSAGKIPNIAWGFVTDFKLGLVAVLAVLANEMPQQGCCLVLLRHLRARDLGSDGLLAAGSRIPTDVLQRNK